MPERTLTVRGVPDAKMVGMRNRIVHGDDHVDPDVVWRVATEHVEPVPAALERIVEG